MAIGSSSPKYIVTYNISTSSILDYCHKSYLRTYHKHKNLYTCTCMSINTDDGQAVPTTFASILYQLTQYGVDIIDVKIF